ncbi:hypothetical protein EJB05_14860 [Eragrostis curvula]|uniref:F-box domain-containing protein n=1 Tax=Eragrostis curvula TaxID=38414 RepID=A0A5J9W0C7_9POAL|nr:hypothetical protein EJB05_14860 [Eragrostis curvula]
MASPDGSAGLDRRVRAAASNICGLPVDAMYDILLRLSAKELCCLRAVCRQWRSLLSNPEFAAAHAARYPEPLIIVGYSREKDDASDWTKPSRYESRINIMDLSGHIVKQLRMDGHITTMSLNLTCIKKTGDGSCRLVNPATGAVHHVPNEDPIYGYSDRLCLFGKVVASREYKVLRKVSYSLHGNPCVLFEIYTICSTTTSIVHLQWRAIEDPPHSICWYEKASVVIHGVVYFLSKSAYSRSRGSSEKQDWIVPFDLDTERWRPSIRGPQILTSINESSNGLVQENLSLTNLNGSLVIVDLPSPSMDLWYLLDFDKGLWFKQYSIQIEDYDRILLQSFCPLIVLDDGRIVIHVGGSEMLEIYDPRTNKLSTVAETGGSCAVSVYAGTLLSLEW